MDYCICAEVELSSRLQITAPRIMRERERSAKEIISARSTSVRGSLFPLARTGPAFVGAPLAIA